MKTIRLLDKIGAWELRVAHEWNYCLPPYLIYAFSIYENVETGERKTYLETLRRE